MKEESIKLLREVIENWKRRKIYTYQQKEVSGGKSPIDKGEILLRFKINLPGFFCQGKEIPISLTSRIFHTATLSEQPLSENASGDKYRLEKFLSDFDEQFDALVSEEFTKCPEIIFTSDPLFF